MTGEASDEPFTMDETDVEEETLLDDEYLKLLLSNTRF